MSGEKSKNGSHMSEQLFEALRICAMNFVERVSEITGRHVFPMEDDGLTVTISDGAVTIEISLPAGWRMKSIEGDAK